MRVDHKSTIASAFFRDNAVVNGGTLQFYGVRRKQSIGVGERYQVLLRHVFSVLRKRYLSLHPETCL